MRAVSTYPILRLWSYHLMWANWGQMMDTHIARLYHEDLRHLGEMGLNGILSCQSFRVFYPSGLAMTALAECLWNPDVPWSTLRRRYLASAYGEHADFAGEYLAMLESFLDSGDPHWRTPPLSNADEDRLAACRAFLKTSLAEIELRREATADRARDRSLDLLAHHARLMLFFVRAYQARLAGDAQQADETFDRAADFLRETEPAYSTYIDTMLALRFVERAKRLR